MLGFWRVLELERDEKIHVRRIWQEGSMVPATAGLEELCWAADVFPPNWSAGFVVGAGGQGSVCILQMIHFSENSPPITP